MLTIDLEIDVLILGDTKRVLVDGELLGIAIGQWLRVLRGSIGLEPLRELLLQSKRHIVDSVELYRLLLNHSLYKLLFALLDIPISHPKHLSLLLLLTLQVPALTVGLVPGLCIPSIVQKIVVVAEHPVPMELAVLRPHYARHHTLWIFEGSKASVVKYLVKLPDRLANHHATRWVNACTTGRTIRRWAIEKSISNPTDAQKVLISIGNFKVLSRIEYRKLVLRSCTEDILVVRLVGHG